MAAHFRALHKIHTIVNHAWCSVAYYECFTTQTLLIAKLLLLGINLKKSEPQHLPLNLAS